MRKSVAGHKEKYGGIRFSYSRLTGEGGAPIVRRVRYLRGGVGAVRVCLAPSRTKPREELRALPNVS